MKGDGLRKLAEIYANKNCEVDGIIHKKVFECRECELNKPVFEWSEDPKLCVWVQYLDNEFQGGIDD